MKKNICIIGQAYVPKIGRQKWYHLDAEPHIVVPSHWPDTMRDVPFETDDTIDVTVIPAYFLGIEPLYFFHPWSFLKVLKRLKPDVIHVENPT